MAFYKTFQDLLLFGTPKHQALPPAPADAPPAVQALIDALAAERKACSVPAETCGDHYRSAFWLLYLLSALAVLFAVMPVGLGWNEHDNRWHCLAPLWGVAELGAIVTIVVVYWRGHKLSWKSRWMSMRLRTELITYMPLAATVLPEKDFSAKVWADCICGGAEDSEDVRAIRALCDKHEALALAALRDAAANPNAWARWMGFRVDGQQAYHARNAHRQHHLQHRVHAINTALFVLTGVGVVAHFFWHDAILLLVATAFPAFGAALHGALAQSEAYRLETNSSHVAGQLAKLKTEIANADPSMLPKLGMDALDLILDEHHGWHHVVRPHGLPLA